MSLPSAIRTSAVDPPVSDIDRLTETFSRHQDKLLGMLYCVLGNGEDARDAYQEAFLKCWRHRDELGEVKNLRAWIFQIALNAGRDLRNTAWRRRRRPLVVEAEIAYSHASDSAGQNHEEHLRLIRQALGKLRAEEQEVFLLRQNAEMTYEEIARSVQIPLGTVKTRMRLALSKLREAVEGERK
ncbi:MAG: sigma-70 family RNA polymerase sigma factor [Pirellulales bacterium]|nr:sigma-70 family RNA polymerase sigma factor [Pirellulales bacterium]